ncbi:TetR/AcrR family transcriptional regulator [Rhodococcus chondri]|uniref:TetR family transcriptional regulator n=1 Tax=Rhodococcus chondri TaxID=3065941 RepID=A0ABU7JYU6_9NOCA|nr:TetR family transcriptional regulator [Rhodococcus sp. CC-R104]MEE2035195.1 TetR family transcriptional regulator [Rhodococcus sp. CC-R104]
MTAATQPEAAGDPNSHRARKRARTWTAIHLAAAEAAATHDRLADVTIEAVAEKAEISPRTFFNYFRSKEDAVLGLRGAVIDRDVAAGFVVEPGGDLVEKVAFLLLAVFRTSNHRQISQQHYVELMDRHPELARKRFQHVDDVEALVTKLVTDKLAESEHWRATHAEHSAEDTARMIVTVAAAVMRMAMRPILAHPGQTEADADAILHRTFALFREVTHS